MNLDYQDEVLFVRLGGSLNKFSTYKINKYLLNLIFKDKIKYLVLNLDSLENIDITGMEALMNTKCAVKMNNGQMYLCFVHNRLRNYLKSLKIKTTDNEIMAKILIGA